jgi:hypothetical protein
MSVLEDRMVAEQNLRDSEQNLFMFCAEKIMCDHVQVQLQQQLPNPTEAYG